MENKLRYVAGWKKKLKALVPRRLKYTLAADVIQWLMSRTHLLDGGDAPPEFVEFAGGGFVPIGNHLVDMIAGRTALADGMAVLDIGCGIGRNAVALSKRFPHLRYVGFDIVRFGITWCRKRFAGMANYQFEHADIFNSFYNPRGRATAATYRFPVPDGEVDLAFATSVFTHMTAADVAHYLQECARCIKQGATVYFTCFMLDDESRRQINAGATLFKFGHPRERSFVEILDEPELAVAFEHRTLLEMASSAGLEMKAFHPGHWRGIAYPDFQDAYVLGKVGRPAPVGR